MSAHTDGPPTTRFVVRGLLVGAGVGILPTLFVFYDEPELAWTIALGSIALGGLIGWVTKAVRREIS
jgi:hypothetical protein